MKEEKTIIDDLEKTASGKYIYKLLKPIKWGDEVRDSIELEEPRAKHIRNLPTKPIMKDILLVVASLSGESERFIDELSIPDITKLGDFIEAFS